LEPYLRLLVTRIRPEKIILFGSYAYGRPTEHSDIDLLIIRRDIQTEKSSNLEIRRLVRNKGELQRRFKVQRLALFGSYARNAQTEKSDVDVLVEVDPSIGLGFVSLAEALEQRLGTRVDLVSHRAVKPSRWPLIERDLIYV